MDFNNDHSSSFYPQYQRVDDHPSFEPQHHGDPSFHNPSYRHPQQEHYQDDGLFPSSTIPNAATNLEGASSPESTHTTSDYPQFDIFEWYPRYQSCQRYFLERAQHSGPVQAVAAFINIRLPFMCGINSTVNPPGNSQTPSHNTPSASSANINQYPQQNNSRFSFSMPNNTTSPRQQQPQPQQQQQQQQLPAPLPSMQIISLIPYLRRLVVTGLDFPGVLHGFFGDDWAAGIGPLHEQERRNYMFAAKSGGWASVKRYYEVGIGGGGGGGGGSSGSGGRSHNGNPHPAAAAGHATGPMSISGGITINDETVPFTRPLQNPKEAELRAAEKAWSEWLLMEDWLIGPRAPVGMREGESGGRGGGGGVGVEGGSGRGAEGEGHGQGQEQRQRQEQGLGSGDGNGEMR